MNRQWIAYGCLAWLALFAPALACTKTDSLGKGGRDGGPANSLASSLGGAGGSEAGTATGGAPAADAAAGNSVGGASGSTPQNTGTPGGQTGASSLVGGAKGGAGSTAGTTLVVDAAISPDTSAGSVDGAAACSTTTATLTVVSGSALDSYCLGGCGLPLKLFKDGTALDLVDYSHAECGSCAKPTSPSCNPNGVPLTLQGYAYPLSQRFVIAGKCSSDDCSTAICLEPGRYKVAYYVYNKQPDGTCGGTPIELAAEFTYPQTTEVKLRFSTSTSCSRNADCASGQVCFHGVSSNTCTPSSNVCTSREPNFGRCMCSGCTCSGSDGADGSWYCVV
jgi:hypothetical protein